MSQKPNEAETTQAAEAPRSRIVRVDGQDFAADGYDNEALRQYFISQGYADFKTAAIKETTNEQGQVVVEFVKKIGTKG